MKTKLEKNRDTAEVEHKGMKKGEYEFGDGVSSGECGEEK